MDYKELIGKTIFDFTKDAALIERVTKVNPSDKEKVAFYKGHCHKINRYNDIMFFAAKTNNMDLYEAAMKARDAAQREFEKRADEGMRNGIIID